MRIFKEEQRFTQTWILVLLTISSIVPIALIVKEYNNEASTMSFNEFLFAIIIIPLCVFPIFFFKLKTRIDEVGIHYRFIPFHFSNRTINWNTITSAKIRTYDAITEYGGWGLKSKFLFRKNKGISYSVSGNIGIQLELISKKKILIGTLKKAEIEAVLKTYSNKLANNEA